MSIPLIAPYRYFAFIVLHLNQEMGCVSSLQVDYLDETTRANLARNGLIELPEGMQLNKNNVEEPRLSEEVEGKPRSLEQVEGQ